MPSLIRLLIILLFLAGIGYGAMLALVVFVEPKQKEVSIRIPARELLGNDTRLPLGDGAGETTTGTPAADETPGGPAPSAGQQDDQPE